MNLSRCTTAIPGRTHNRWSCSSLSAGTYFGWALFDPSERFMLGDVVTAGWIVVFAVVALRTAFPNESDWCKMDAIMLLPAKDAPMTLPKLESLMLES